MEQSEINRRNEAIALFMGYKYTYMSTEDLSDIGGLETTCKIYSKIPLKIDYCLDPIHWKEDRDKFILITVKGWDINPSMGELQYNSSWDWLMPVIEKISEIKYEDGSTMYPRTFGMINQEAGKVLFRFNRMGLYEGRTLIEAAFLATSDYCLSIK